MSDPEDERLAERAQERATRPGPPPQPAATEADPPSLGSGTLLAGRFRIVRFVARGGMGAVDVYALGVVRLSVVTVRHRAAVGRGPRRMIRSGTPMAPEGSAEQS